MTDTMRPIDPDEQDARERGDDVRRLIRLAGRRPSVPAERAARVRAVARDRWQGVVRRRRDRRFLWMGAALAAAATLTIFVSLDLREDSAPPTPTPTYLVESVVGNAWATTGDEDPAARTVLREDARLPFGTTLVTDREGRLELRLATTGLVRIDAGSRLRVIDPDRIELDAGAIYVDSGDRGAEVASLIVGTPLGPVREIGTQFEVRLLEEGLRVRVREGRVAVEAAGAVHEVPVAAEMTIDGAGGVTRREIPIHGNLWDWVAGIATVPDMDGVTARDFLDYVARERGWVLRFADSQTEQAADRITIGGTIDRLKLTDALDAVLPTCGMEHAAQDGTLLVSLAGAGS